MSEAILSLWGPEFVKLDATLEIIDKLSAERLCDAVWQVLRLWQEQPKDQPSQSVILTGILQQLSNVLELHSTNVITREELNSREGWELVDQALDILEKSDADQLRKLLLKAMECWDSAQILKILSSEFGELSPEERRHMEEQALELIQTTNPLDI
jgi:hypothetical protein